MKSISAARSPRAVREAPAGSWTFLTHHAHVLLSVAADPEARLRDLAERVGLTERAVQRIVSDLLAGGYVSVTKVGRRNRYRVNGRLALRHPIERHRTVKALVELVLGPRG
ncbi:MAG TPA: MarR family transcriptional regulator [Thermoanaerobaculia bacterium]|nr:MarR family transcriptional regulator [Thermoanaerobaculia bacterium]